MRHTFFILCITFASARYSADYAVSLEARCGRSEFDHRKPERYSRMIFNGRLATKGEYPSQVALLQAEQTNETITVHQRCAGSLISSIHVLTAAHCFFEANGTLRSNIYIGLDSVCAPECSYDSKPKLRAIKQYIHYTNYKNSDVERDDIMLLIMDQALDENHHACLPSSDTVLSERLDLVGWGMTEGDGFYEKGASPRLRYASVDLWREEEKRIIAWPGPSDACKGDSGGGLYQNSAAHKRTLVGIVSRGQRGCRGESGVMDHGALPTYTRVAYYYEWICYWSGVCTADRPAADITYDKIAATTIETYAYALGYGQPLSTTTAATDAK